MIDPGLPAAHFTTDTRIVQKQIYGPGQLAGVKGAEPGPDGAFFQAEGRLCISLDQSLPDLSLFNRLTLRIANKSRTVLLIGLSLVHDTPPEKNGPDWISFSGGREPVGPGETRDLQFPRECFGTYGHPPGWCAIRQILIHVALEKTETLTLPVRVMIHSLTAERIKVPAGPRLTNRGLEALTTDVRELPFFCQKKGLFASTWPGFTVPPPHDHPVESARRILDGWIMGRKTGRPLDWLANPLGHLEWTHFLNRHHFLRPLVKAWVETRDPRYPRAIDLLVRSWIRQNPLPLNTNGGAGPTWETLTAAWRLREWFWIAGLVWPSEHFSPQTRQMMLRSIWEHAVSLVHHQGHPNNWIIVESAALALAGMCFPGFVQAETWIRTGLDRLQREGRRQFFADGGHYEISPLYQSICVSAWLEVRQTAKKLGIAWPKPADLRLEKAVDHLAALARPDFTWPSINDSGGISRDYTAVVNQAGVWSGRPDFIWIGSRGRKGKVPAGHFRIFPDSGLAVMRSDYSSRAHCLIFRSGPAGAAHVHDDILSLDLTAFGVPFLVDPGISTYAPTPLTPYYRSARAHNTILIEGNDPLRLGAGFSQRTRPAGSNLTGEKNGPLEVAIGIYDGPWAGDGENFRICRRIIWVNRLYWIVWDFIQGPAPSTVRVGWQLTLDQADIETTSGTIKMERHGSSLLLLPMPGPHGLTLNRAVGQEHPPLGWISVQGRDVPAIHAEYSLRAVPPLGLAWLLFPGEAKAPVMVRAFRKDDPSGRTALTIHYLPGRVDRITVGPPEQAAEYQLIQGMDPAK